MTGHQNKPKPPTYTKADVEGWIAIMQSQQISGNKYAKLNGISPTTIANKLAAYYAGELD